MTSDHSSNGNGRADGTPTTSSGTDTSAIRSLVSQTRRLLRSTWVATGLLASFGLGLLLVVTMTMTDFLVSSAVPSEWTALRAISLVLLVVPTTWAVIAGVLKPLFRRLSNVLVARRIETELPKIHNRLVTCIDLEDEEQAVPVSEAFHRKLVSEALERIKGFHPRRVLDIQNLRRATVVATVGVLALAVIFIPGVSTAMQRVFSPFSDIPPDGHVSYTVKVGNAEQQQQGDGYVVRGDDVEFLVEFTDGRPLLEGEALQLTIETVNDENEEVVIRHASPISAKLESRDGRGFWKFGLKGLEHDFHYRVSGGGTYTPRYRVDMLERPEIVSVGTTLTYPEYMEKPERNSEVADIEGPVGSTVQVGVRAEGDIHEGVIEFLELKRVRQAVVDRSARNWFASTRPKGSAPSGTWKVESLAGQDAHTDPPNTAAHSHGFTKATEPFEVGTSDVLFSTVYLPPDQMPRQIMLKWHDGQGWEHRAFWGEDLIGEGKPGTSSRFRVGDLPKPGRVVTLEVPAAAVGLAGRSVSGMMFSLHGGQAVWGNSGAMPPSQETVVKLLPTGQTFELKRTTPTSDSKELEEGQSYFSGTFPLVENGLYRVQLKNKADRYNQTMAEAKIVAIPDNPPQVIIERPRQTLILSRPQPVPVFITSFDDFGVKEVLLSVKTGDQEAFVGEPVVTLSPPLQNDRRDITLDLADRGLKTGDTLTYRVEVRDGNGQSGQTIDYVIQIKEDNSAADKQFEQLEKQTDTFRDKLVELISKQEKVKVKANKLEQDYKELTEKIEKAKLEADRKEQDEAKDDKTKKDPKAEKKAAEEKPIELDPEEQKKLDALKKELAALAAEENANVKLSEQVKNDLGALAKQAEENPLVPPQVADQIKQLEDAFEKAAVDPLKQLAKELQQAATPKQQDTKLPEINKQAERVQKDLEAIQKRMDALARAQRDSRDDLKQAMRDLKKDLLQQDADLTQDALKDLKEYLKAMQKDLEALKGKEENLLKDSLQELTSKDLLDALREQQEEAAKKSDKKLDEAADLLDAKRQKQLDFPDRPYKPEDKDYKIPPKERDTDEGDPTKEDEGEKKKGDKSKDKDKKKGEQEEPEEDFLLPALSGLRAELDPRFEKMIRDLKEKLKKQQEKGEKGDPDQQDRNRKQLQRLEELDTANRALKGDQKSLEDLQDQLQQAQKKSQQDGQPPQQQQQAQKSLEQMLQQALMQKAKQMMQRMQQQQGQQANQPQDQQKNQQKNQQPMPPQSTLASQLIGNQKPDGQATEQVLVDLGKFDVATQRVIMKMQPKEREELLQGLREEGPKAYQGFIRDYFKKLSRARSKVPKK